ncbi:P-loop containing nucleoside triphosphate hydrolase protein [Hypoxylon sp. FL1150]|nr:P-loop containing nucleoside triphosphate hydrolase protein [Hypoxylon sp. FL1150]
MTGSGKTTFISKVTGRTDLKIGHDLTSCTQDIQVVDTELDGRIVRFVDTPGFSDTYLSDTEVLEMIADYLAMAYSQKIQLSGIIYLHPISHNRVTHHATKNLDMFRKLTGEKNLKNVMLTTSMWDKGPEEEGVKRERELKNKFWDVLIAFGARYARHDGTECSAKRIASLLVRNKPFYLQLQEEMGGANKALKDTAAGQEIMAELEQMKVKHQKELAEMKEMLQRTSAEENKAAAAALEKHYQKMLRELERTLADERRMNDATVKSLTERLEALERRGEGSFCAVM